MVGDGERLDEGSDVGGKIAQRVDEGRIGDNDIFRESPTPAGEPVIARLGAEVVLFASEAVFTFPAQDVGLKGHPVAHGESGDTVPQLMDHAG
jgi:hypothetical protein